MNICKKNFYYRNGSASFQLRVARSTSSHLKQLIKNALEKTLNQCQQLNLLPSNIFLSHSKRPRFNLYSRRRTGFEQIMENRCSKLIDILIYAQQILCWYLIQQNHVFVKSVLRDIVIAYIYSEKYVTQYLYFIQFDSINHVDRYSILRY